MQNQTREIETLRELLKAHLKERNVDPVSAFSEIENGFMFKAKTPQASIVCAVYRGLETQTIYMNLEVGFATGSNFELIKLKVLIEETLSDIPMPFRPIIADKQLALQISTPVCWITDQMLTEAIDCMLHSSNEFMSAALERGLLVTSARSEEHDPERISDLAETRTLN